MQLSLFVRDRTRPRQLPSRDAAEQVAKARARWSSCAFKVERDAAGEWVVLRQWKSNPWLVLCDDGIWRRLKETDDMG